MEYDLLSTDLFGSGPILGTLVDTRLFRKTNTEQRETFMVTSRELGYYQLRAIVIALCSHRDALKQKLTFSHGNLANDIEDIAAYLDALVTDLEPGDELLLLKKEDYATSEHRMQETIDAYKATAQQHLRMAERLREELNAAKLEWDNVKALLGGPLILDNDQARSLISDLYKKYISDAPKSKKRKK